MKMQKLYLKLFVSALAIVPTLSHALPITVDFTVLAERVGTYGETTYNGHVPGATGVGHFTFDDAGGPFSVPTYGGGSGRVASDLSFSWLGRQWDETNANIGMLNFDGGALTQWSIGGVFDGDCGVRCVDSIGPSDFWARSDAGPSSAVLHDHNAWGFMWGSVSWSVREIPVPTPGVLGLFSLGLVGAVFLGRRRKVALNDTVHA